jgi:hypothetical protein
MADCLEALVGLTDIDCDCYTDLRPDTWNVSESGRFITDPEVGFPTIAAVFESSDCGSEFWGMLTKSKTQSLRDFRHELQIRLKQYFERRVPSFRGLLGKTRTSGRSYPSRQYIGDLIRFQPWRDARMIINRVGLNLSVSATVPVVIDSNDPDFEPKTIEIETVAGRSTFVDLTEVIPLNFHTESISNLFYAIYYELPEGAYVNDNKASCGCTGADPLKQNVLSFGGFTSDTLEDLDCVTPGQNANGLSIGCYFDCDYTNFLCNLSQLSANDLLDDVAAAIQAKAAAKLISLVIESGVINRYTLKPIEELSGRRTRLQNNFAQYVDAIAKNYRPELSGCWSCKSNSSWKKVPKPM